MFDYLKFRKSKFGSIKKGHPLFINKKGNIFKHEHMLNFMWNVIVNINKGLNIKLKPSHYTPHQLRSGACTDLARKGKPGWYIEIWCRWSSKTWKDHYINLDWRDLALLTNTTITDLQSKIVTKPYVD